MTTEILFFIGVESWDGKGSAVVIHKMNPYPLFRKYLQIASVPTQAGIHLRVGSILRSAEIKKLPISICKNTANPYTLSLVLTCLECFNSLNSHSISSRASNVPICTHCREERQSFLFGFLAALRNDAAALDLFERSSEEDRRDIRSFLLCLEYRV